MNEFLVYILPESLGQLLERTNYERISLVESSGKLLEDFVMKSLKKLLEGLLDIFAGRIP